MRRRCPGRSVRPGREDDPVYTVDLLANVSDQDGDALHIANLTSPLPAGLTLGSDGHTLRIDPNAYNSLPQGGSALISLSYDVVDVQGASVPQTAKITISGVNDAPTVAGPVAATATEDAAPFTVDLLGTTYDWELNNSLSDSLGGPALHANGGSLGPTGYSFGPNQGLDVSGLNINSSGPYSIELRFSFTDLSGYRKIIDFGNLISDAGMYDLNGQANFYPVASGAAAFLPNTPATLLFTRSATGDVKVYVDGAEQLSFHDTQDYSLLSALNFFMDDYATSTNEASGGFVDYIRISGSASNIDEGHALHIANLTEALPVGLSLDPDGHTLHIDPSAYNALAQGYNAALNISYDVVDEHGASVVQTAGITITGVNDAPAATPVTLAAIAEDSGARLITSAELLAGVTDVDGPSLSITALSIQSGSGTLVNNNNGTWSYTPGLNDDTAVTFSYTASDGTLTASSTATLDITPVNDAPVAPPVTLAAIAEDSGTRLITSAELLAGVTDIDSANLSITALAIQSGQGTLVNNNNGTWSYTPALNDDTSVTFSYTASDGTLTASSTATLDITPVNDAPVTTPVTLAAIAEDSGARLITQAELLAKATDIDSANLSITALAIQSGQGTLVNNNNGTWSYTPALNDDTSVTFSYAATDGAAASSTATLDITPVNDAPVNGAPLAAIATIGQQTVFSAANGNAITVSDMDVNETPAPENVLSVSLAVNAGTLTLASTVGITIVGGANGSASVTIVGTVASLNTALDGLVYSPSASFTGNDQLTITTSDLGHTGGGTLTDTDIVALAQNVIFGTENNDPINGTAGPDLIIARGGDDTINALAGNDVVYGGAGNDIIRTGIFSGPSPRTTLTAVRATTRSTSKAARARARLPAARTTTAYMRRPQRLQRQH